MCVNPGMMTTEERTII